MKKSSISPRTIELLVGILALALLITGILFYALDEPSRIARAQEQQTPTDLDEAMTLYAENCVVCHGLSGDGIGSAPALNREDLRSADVQALSKIIARGLPNTAMPAWSEEDGGPLNSNQVERLANLILDGDWMQTQDRVVNLGLAPRVPFTTQPDPKILNELQNLPNGEMLTQGVTIFAEQCVACHGADGLGSSLAPGLNDPVIREKSVEDLERSIRYGIAGTNMAAWSSRLADDDIAGLVELIRNWDRVPPGAIPAPNRPVAVTAESLEQGAALYSANCARCHGPEGQGTPRAPALNVRKFLTDTNDAAVQQIITLGVTGTAMPAWGDRLSDAEIQSIVGFVRSWEPDAPEVAAPARGGGPWWRSSGGTNGQTLPSGGAKLQGGSKGPAWSQNVTTQSVRTSLDLRSVAISAGVIFFGIFLVVFGMLELKRVSNP